MSDVLVYGRVVADHWQVLHQLHHGQRGLLDRKTNTVYFHLREAFHTASKQFGWLEQAPGIGLNQGFVEWAAAKGYTVRVFVEGFNSKCYESTAESWAEWSRQGGVWQLDNGVVLYELPWTEGYFRTVHAYEDEVVVDAWRVLQMVEAGKV